MRIWNQGVRIWNKAVLVMPARYIVEAEPIRDDTLLRIKDKSGNIVEGPYSWSGSLLAQAFCTFSGKGMRS